MSLFANAAAAKKEVKKVKTPKKKATIWSVGDKDGDKIAKAVGDLVDLNAQKKAVEAKMDIPKRMIAKHAEDCYVEAYADLGVPPETPMQVQNQDGAKVTYVVQDRSSQYGVKDEQVEALTQILGEDGAQDLLCSETTFAFQRSATTNPEIMGVIEKHLGNAVEELVEAGLVEGILDVIDPKEKMAFKPGTMDRLGMICGKNTSKIRKVLQALGSAAVRYIKC
jgi:hypothetical protein